MLLYVEKYLFVKGIRFESLRLVPRHLPLGKGGFKGDGNFRTLAEGAFKGYFPTKGGGDMLYNRKAEPRAADKL